MCGICGIVGRADERMIATMAQTLAHRGPDGEGARRFPADGRRRRPRPSGTGG